MTRPLWVDPDQVTYPALDHHIEVDVAVVGAGLTGMGAAYALHDRGASVAVLEQRTVGSGASGRNGGFVLAGPAMAYRDAVRQFGADGARAIWDFTLENNRWISDIIERHQIECGYLRRGSMTLAACEQEMDELAECAADMAAAGLPAAPVDRRDLPRPFDRLYFGGLYHAGNGEMSSGAFVRGVAQAVSGSVSLFEQSPARALRRVGERWTVETPGGVISAGVLLLACNGYTQTLVPTVPIVPTRGQVIATAPLDRVLVPFPMYADNGFQYWRQTVEGRLVIGGWRNLDWASEVGMEDTLHGPIQIALDGFRCDIGAGDAPVEYRWSGVMGFTPDMTPLVGRVPDQPGLWMAVGYSGHGVSMAFLCGARLALQALGEDALLPSAFDPGRPITAAANPWEGNPADVSEEALPT